MHLKLIIFITASYFQKEYFLKYLYLIFHSCLCNPSTFIFFRDQITPRSHIYWFCNMPSLFKLSQNVFSLRYMYLAFSFYKVQILNFFFFFGITATVELSCTPGRRLYLTILLCSRYLLTDVPFFKTLLKAYVSKVRRLRSNASFTGLKSLKLVPIWVF